MRKILMTAGVGALMAGSAFAEGEADVTMTDTADGNCMIENSNGDSVTEPGGCENYNPDQFNAESFSEDAAD
jgi:hypothetical protein